MAEATPEPGVALATWAAGVMPDVAEREELQRRIIEQNMQATTLKEVFTPRKTIAAKDYVGKPIEVRNVILAEGSIEGKDSVYLLIDAIDLTTGEVIVLNTGAPNVCSMLYNLKQRDMLPVQVAVIEVGAAPSPGQNRPLSLEPVGVTAEAVDREG